MRFPLMHAFPNKLVEVELELDQHLIISAGADTVSGI